MKIVINHRPSLLFIGDTMLKPGTNVFNSFDESTVKDWISEGFVTVKDSSEISAAEAKDAVTKSYDEKTVERLEKEFGDKVKEGAKKQKKLLQDEEAEFQKAAEEYRKNKGKK